MIPNSIFVVTEYTVVGWMDGHTHTDGWAVPYHNMSILKTVYEKYKWYSMESFT